MSQLKKLLKEYVGGDLTLLGEIPEDPAMEQSVRAYVPVVQHTPTSPASVALMKTADTIMSLLTSPLPLVA